MGTYRVEHEGVTIECDTLQAALDLTARLKGKPEPAAAQAAPEVQVISPNGHAARALGEIETAGKVVWNFLTGDKDPRQRIWDAFNDKK